MQERIIRMMGNFLEVSLNEEQKEALLEMEFFVFAVVLAAIVKFTYLGEILQGWDQALMSISGG